MRAKVEVMRLVTARIVAAVQARFCCRAAVVEKIDLQRRDAADRDRARQ